MVTIILPGIEQIAPENNMESETEGRIFFFGGGGGIRGDNSLEHRNNFYLSRSKNSQQQRLFWVLG